MKWRPAILAAAMMTLAFPSQPLAAKRALVIGISEYAPGVNQLRGPREDARNMEKLLKDSMGYQAAEIKVLIDRQATRENILRTMQEWLVDQTAPGDDVLFYFSGHGAQRPDQNGDEADGYDETLVPTDVRVEKDGTASNMITDDEIEQILSRLEGRHSKVIIDSCHSGTVTRGIFLEHESAKTPVGLSRGAKPVAKSFINAHRAEESFVPGQSNRIVWTAVSAWQKALVDFESNHGSVFTNRFIEGLRDRKADRNRDGKVTNSELLDYLQVESDAFCKRNAKRCQTGLTPTLEAEKDLLVVDASAFSATPTSTPAQQSTIAYVEESLSHTNDGTVGLVLRPGRSFRLGEKLEVRVSSPIDGYLLLLDVNSAGELTQLFPNQFSEQARINRIAANEPVVVPGSTSAFDLTAVEPVGTGYVVAVVVEDSVDLSSVLNGHKDLQIIPDPRTYIQGIAANLLDVWTGDLTNRRVKWSLVKESYEIVP